MAPNYEKPPRPGVVAGDLRDADIRRARVRRSRYHAPPDLAVCPDSNDGSLINTRKGGTKGESGRETFCAAGCSSAVLSIPGSGEGIRDSLIRCGEP